MSASLSPRPEAAILPSLPPSPSLLEEVFSHPRPWSFRREQFDPQGSRRSSSPASPGSHTKGKGKQISEDEGDEEDNEDAQHRVYPPMTDRTAETRRVEETLKRWELAERQRRRSVRESAAQHTSGPSLLSSVTHTATLVLSGRTTSIGTSVGPGGTRAFKSHESVDIARGGYAVPLDDIDHARSSGDVIVHSPSPSIFDRSASLDAGTASGSGTSENPFVHPSERTRPHTPTCTPLTPTPTRPPSTPPSPSPFADAHAQQASLQANPTTRLSAESNTHARKRSSRSGLPFVPPPRPLDLPPPPDDIPRVAPPQPTSQPILRPQPPREDPEEREEVRWWHDWLCGCGEGPDRGGDNQAGRTNPFE